jgi:inner membrane transporter RhtA
MDNGMQVPARIRSARVDRVPAQAFFLISAIFHYLGPSLAVLLFARIDVLGVAWLRVATASLVFALWRRPWSVLLNLDADGRRLLVELGIVLGAMNSSFYLALARLPLSSVSSIEFLGIVVLGSLGAKSPRNVAALALATMGVATITGVRIGGQLLGFAYAFSNCGLLMLYVILAHRMANRANSIDCLGAAMLVAMVVTAPLGIASGLRAFANPLLLMAAAGVGICSSVIPYVADQLAMARLPRASFATMLALLPMFSVIIGAIVLGQIPTFGDLLGVLLVVGGVSLHEVPKREATAT